MHRVAIALFLLLLAGCAAGPATVIVQTDPPGGTVRVDATDEVAAHGSAVVLPAGAYRFTGESPGYRAGTVEAEVLAGQEQRLTVPLGPGFALVELRALPAEALIRIDEQHEGQGILRMELEAGAYAVEVALEDFETQRQSIQVEPGVPLVRAFRLEPKRLEVTPEEPPPPTHGRVQVEPEPANAMLQFRGRDLGRGAQDLGALPPGTHRVSGVATLGPGLRLTGAREFAVAAGEDLRVELRLAERERLFEGEWLAEAEALRREERRYQGQRVRQPIAVDLYPSGGALEALRRDDRLRDALFTLLRVGDRVTVHAAGGPWEIWKRHREVTGEFTAAVDALRNSAASTQPWRSDPVRSVRAQATAEPLAAVAFALHGARNVAPHLDLEAPQLDAGGVRVDRSLADGPITLVVLGGQGVEVLGNRLESFGALRFGELSAGNGAIELRWQVAPQRILLVGDTAGPVRVPGGGGELPIGQRGPVSLAPAARVHWLERLSYGPDFESWQRERFDTSGPLGFQLDLTRDEIGPHQNPGPYRRIWLVGYEQDGQPSQRQVAIDYRVGTHAGDGEIREFIRRAD